MAIHEGVGPFHFYTGYTYHPIPCGNDIWEQIDKVCRKEVYSYLPFCAEDSLAKRYLQAVSQMDEIDDLLSIIEIGCYGLLITSGDPQHRDAEATGISAIEEINARFLQHAVGYQFESQQIIRIDSTYIHKEIIKPALKILLNPQLVGANNEFMAAHKHYRNGSYKDAVVAANRAFESVLKIICETKKWSYKKGDRATELISIVCSNGLLSHQFDKVFGAYVAMMKSGLPVIRNDAGAHGDGLNAAAVTSQIAGFAINMTAVNITFLSEII